MMSCERSFFHYVAQLGLEDDDLKVTDQVVRGKFGIVSMSSVEWVQIFKRMGNDSRNAAILSPRTAPIDGPTSKLIPTYSRSGKMAEPNCISTMTNNYNGSKESSLESLYNQHIVIRMTSCISSPFRCLNADCPSSIRGRIAPYLPSARPD